MSMINQDQVTGVIRILVPAVCTWLAAKGWSMFGDTGVQAQVIVIAIGIVSITWSFFDHSDSAKMKAVARIDPGVKVTVPDHVTDNNNSVRTVVDDARYPNVVRKGAV